MQFSPQDTYDLYLYLCGIYYSFSQPLVSATNTCIANPQTYIATTKDDG